eukprot:TRINITY_DN8152_c0_g1_i1.p3 TRINITY_DN8152_c0_g1~~TRINITY_DN8152_c0_g1_i1.p3  ORF type:complete len:142 (+),score=3.95 TRINITY_DN8152_c0_g1_i1:630-1055(+)
MKQQASNQKIFECQELPAQLGACSRQIQQIHKKRAFYTENFSISNIQSTDASNPSTDTDSANNYGYWQTSSYILEKYLSNILQLDYVQKILCACEYLTTLFVWYVEVILSTVFSQLLNNDSRLNSTNSKICIMAIQKLGLN